ncbi:hypothetical protein ACFLTE_02590 [Bacteroidota bacterium]
MKKRNKTYILGIIVIIISIIVIACEFEEPFEDPVADFELYEINQATFLEEKMSEPYSLNSNREYILRITGKGEQFVLWLGVPADSGKTDGSDFNDRGVNHNSEGELIEEKEKPFVYRSQGSFEMVVIASSYRYSDDHYVEDILKKSVEVVAP